PEFNQANRQAIVVTHVENRTTYPGFNYDIFLRRLRTNLGQHGRDRVYLVANRDHLEHMRQSELDVARDPFGQGDGMQPAGNRVQPEWNLWGRFTNLPNRGTDYYYAEFNLTNMRTGQEIPFDF